MAVGAIAAFGAALLLGRIWHACNVGFNAANSMALLFFYGPVIFAVAAGSTFLAYTVVKRFSGSTVLARTSTVVIAVAVVWVAQVLFHGDAYPSAVCSNNVPPWWPNWIPL